MMPDPCAEPNLDKNNPQASYDWHDVAKRDYKWNAIPACVQDGLMANNPADYQERQMLFPHELRIALLKKLKCRAVEWSSEWDLCKKRNLVVASSWQFGTKSGDRPRLRWPQKNLM